MNRTLSLWSLLILATVLVTWSCQAETAEGQFPGDCNDGADNDMDGLFDCDDETCAGSPLCEGAGDDDDTVPVGDDDTVAVGDDDTGPPGDDDTGGPPGDDDTHGGGGGDGGPGESGINCQPDYCPNCEDGIDNDGDGSIDCADPDCSDFCGGGGGGGQGDDDSHGGGGQGDDDSQGGGGGGGTEGGGQECQPTSCPECEDGQDNDGDGLIDCADDGCSDWCGS